MEPATPTDDKITFITYTSESQLPWISSLMEQDLSEPYSIFTYRYFINNWPGLCWMAMSGGECVGAVVCKLELHKMTLQGYIAMLAVNSAYRGKGLGTTLVEKAIYAMQAHGCNEVVLETEVTNKGALRLYEKLGFIRDKRLAKYYLNGVDAFKLKLTLLHPSETIEYQTELAALEAKNK